jgi:membrane-bound serine protease (ClpP class)
MTLFIILLIAGLMLVGAEVFIPGGVLGTLGGLALLGAVITAFQIFSAGTATAIAGGILIMVGVAVALWIKYFPKTWFGKQMILNDNLHDAKATSIDLLELLGQEGITTSSLRPGGFANIGGQRHDVITQGEMIDNHTTVRVIEVEGNRVVVALISAE